MRLTLVLIGTCVLAIGSLARAQTTPDPSPNQFIDVSEEPHETIPLEKLIVYPESARRSGLEGAVTLDALIGKDGSFEKVTVLKSDYDVFKDAAIDAMMREKFTPARQNGIPLKIWITRTIHFRLNGGKGPPNFNQNQKQSNLVNRNQALFNFRKFIGINLDSARDFVRRFGALQETAESGGIHLHSETPSSTSGRTTVDGIVGD
ncbi:MAG: energy transducer TonB, partial [Candidatus Kapaibacterium sp.]